MPTKAVNDLLVGNWNMDQYGEDYQALYKTELPSFTAVGICGNCGKNENDFSDPDWVDFLSYVQYKAIAKQLPKNSLGPSSILTGFEILHGPTVSEKMETAPLGTDEKLRLIVGDSLLRFIAKDVSLEKPSPFLQDIQSGVSSILDAFEKLGYCEYARLF